MKKIQYCGRNTRENTKRGRSEALASDIELLRNGYMLKLVDSNLNIEAHEKQ